MLRISKLSNKHNEEGYVLSITLIMLTITLLFLSSFMKHHSYYEDWTKTLQETASIQLIAQDVLESSKEEVVHRFDQAIERAYTTYKTLYNPQSEEEQKLIEVLAVAGAYLEVSQSFFLEIPYGLSFSDQYLIRKQLTLRTPHLNQDTWVYVTQYNYVKDTLFVSRRSKKEFVTYETLRNKVDKLKYSWEADRGKLEDINKQLQNKILYEVVTDVQVKNNRLGSLETTKTYLTLKLLPNEQKTMPYRLVVEEYVTDYQ